MYHLYVVQKYLDYWDEIPETQREWWFLVLSSEDKQSLLDWHSKYRYPHAYGFKLVQASGNLPDFFYPRREYKRQTNAGKLLRSMNWKYELCYEKAENTKTA